jgi:hypothetical protein
VSIRRNVFSRFGILKTQRSERPIMNAILSTAATNATEPSVQTAVINSAGALVGLVSVLLAAAWIAYLYR